MKRSRGRNRRSGGNNQNPFSNPNRHFESVGPDVKIRGSAQQVLEKYLQYGRDAQTSGDRVLSEAYFQYAEHYQRIVAKQLEARGQPQQNGPYRGRDDRDPRGPGDRDSRGGDDGPPDEAREENAEVVEAAEAEEETTVQGRSAAAPESLRVIDEAEGSDEAREDAPERAAGERGRGRRRPPRSREDKEAAGSGAAVPEIEGVMKTLSRGRRRAASEEGAPAEPAE
jgi:hypothetical protein